MRFVLLLIFATNLNGDLYPLRFEGNFEGWRDKIFELAAFFLPPDPTVLQAGAYYGEETALLAQKWPKGRIISFEPNPHAFELLRARVALLKNVETYPLALNWKDGRAPFYICHGTYGKDPAFEHASSLLKPSPQMEVHYGGPIVDVECRVLNGWCREKGIEKIDFMSLNVQGAELQVLQSSPEIVKTVRCLWIHTHFFPSRIGISPYPELRSLLETLGFRLLAHWYRGGLEGDALFVKNDCFCSELFKIEGQYQTYYEPFFKTYYRLDDEPDSIKETLKRGLPYEGNIGMMIDELIRPGSVAIDVGAHIGVHTIAMSRKAGSKGAVLAFEPHKKLYPELLQNLSLNRCSNVVAIAKGLGEERGRAYLNQIKIEEGGGGRIEIIPLDSLTLSNVSLIKMDVENYEYFVLKGAKETIAKNKPVIIFECWIGADYEKSNPKEKMNFDRVVDLLESYGYEIYVIYSNDFIAFPKGEMASYKKRFKKLDRKAFDLG